MSTCFESASLDTNILIHLWKSGTEAMLGKMFGKAYVYQWLIDVELRHHADAALMERIIEAMEDGFLEPVDGLAIVPAVQKANRAKIPVIATNRDLDGGEFAQVMSDEKQAGILQGEYMAKHLPQGAKVVYLMGDIFFRVIFFIA